MEFWPLLLLITLFARVIDPENHFLYKPSLTGGNRLKKLGLLVFSLFLCLVTVGQAEPTKETLGITLTDLNIKPSPRYNDSESIELQITGPKGVLWKSDSHVTIVIGKTQSVAEAGKPFRNLSHPQLFESFDTNEAEIELTAETNGLFKWQRLTIGAKGKISRDQLRWRTLSEPLRGETADQLFNEQADVVIESADITATLSFFRQKPSAAKLVTQKMQDLQSAIFSLQNSNINSDEKAALLEELEPTRVSLEKVRTVLR